MTISSNVPRVTLNMNGATTDVPYPYPVLAQADIQVIETVLLTGVQTVKAYTTDYTFVETPDASGAYLAGVTVRALVAPSALVSWTVINDPEQTQKVDLTDNGALPVDTQVERPLDRLTLMLQRIRDLANRSLRQPDGDPVTVGFLPAVSQRLSKYLGFDGSGNPTALAAPTGTSITSVFGQSLIDDPDAPTARATLGAASAAEVDADELILDSLKQAVINPIINGLMEVWQRGTLFTGAGSGPKNVSDRFQLNGFSASVLDIRQSTNVPTVAQSGVLFNYSLEVDVTTADAAVGAADNYYIAHHVEGFNFRHFAQRQFTLSFWVMATKTGVHCVSFANSNGDRTFIAEYTVNVSNTWEYKTVTVAASPSAGTWNYQNQLGLRIAWVLIAGSNVISGTVGAWHVTTGQIASANQVNDLDNAANFFRLTGVKMELGPTATPYQYAPFELELIKCKRFFQKSFLYAVAPAQNAGNNAAVQINSPFTATSPMGLFIRHDPPMRTTFPTVVGYNPGAANTNVRNTTDAADDNSPSVINQGDSGFHLQFTPNAANTVGDLHAWHWTADAEF